MGGGREGREEGEWGAEGTMKGGGGEWVKGERGVVVLKLLEPKSQDLPS